MFPIQDSVSSRSVPVVTEGGKQFHAARAEELQMSDTTMPKQIFLSMLNNGEVTGDKVGPHGDLLNEFPYLGPPHD
jgi:hypothetical protein